MFCACCLVPPLLKAVWVSHLQVTDFPCLSYFAQQVPGAAGALQGAPARGGGAGD